jgi:hypothetical protein
MVPADLVTTFEARSLVPLRLAVTNRLPPYHQPSLPKCPQPFYAASPLLSQRYLLQRHFHGSPQSNMGVPILPLADTRGRRAPVPVTQIHANGVIREAQYHEALFATVLLRLHNS